MRDPYKRLPKKEEATRTRLSHVQEDLTKRGIDYDLDMLPDGKWKLRTFGTVVNQSWIFSADHVLISTEQG